MSAILDSIINIRKQLKNAQCDNGLVAGIIAVSAGTLADLQVLSENFIIEDTVVIGGKTVPIEKLQLEDGSDKDVSINLLTYNLENEAYYENLSDFISANPYAFPHKAYYIHELAFLSGGAPLHQELLKYKDVINLVQLLSSLADFRQDLTGEPRVLIFFDKKKMSVPLIFNRNHCRIIPFLDSLREDLMNAHDKDQRATIFKNEMISTLLENKEEERFGNLLFKVEEIYNSYLKSHLLYIEKFSYHDLKSEIDNDKLEYTKKIYGTVNDVQTKLIAVPAAFLLVLSQFDFSGASFNKNLFITIGSVLFSVLLEILLSNQFGLLRYIEKEIKHFSNELKNKQTSVDLSEFVRSFADLDPIVRSQRNFLWIFRSVVWCVPVLSLVMLFAFNGEQK